MPNEDPLTWLGELDWRGDHRRFGIKRSDRRYHMAIVGRTGMGKSTLMRAMMWSDILSGEGFALIDPHGDLAEEIAAFSRRIRAEHLSYFNPAAPDGVLALNILEATGTKPHLIASGVLSVFKKLWEDFWGPRLEHVFRNALLALAGIPGTTLGDVPRVLLDPSFRRTILSQVSDEKVREFWFQEYDRYTVPFRMQAISPILNKIGQFLAIPEVRRVLCQPRSSFDLREIMDEGKIFVANLSRGRLGEDASALLGALLVTKFELAALSRADISLRDRRQFYFYVDEFPTLATPSFAGMLAESRKYAVALVVAMQFVDQVEVSLRDALFENVGTLAVFRAGPGSARILAPQLEVVSKEDLINLPRYCFYIRLIFDGQPYPPFSGRTVWVEDDEDFWENRSG